MKGPWGYPQSPEGTRLARELPHDTGGRLNRHLVLRQIQSPESRTHSCRRVSKSFYIHCLYNSTYLLQTAKMVSIAATCVEWTARTILGWFGLNPIVSVSLNSFVKGETVVGCSLGKFQ